MFKQDDSARTTAKAAAAVGLSRRTFEKAAAVVGSRELRLIAEMDRTGSVNAAFQKLRILRATEAIEDETEAFPDGPFCVIVCDPPWRYDDPRYVARAGAPPCPSMSLAELKAMDVGRIAAPDCVLWLWSTNAHIWDAKEISEAWGFSQRTMLTWAKNRIGTGEWLRGQTEHCLLCTRGKPVIRLTNQTTLLTAPAGKHSAKPAEFFALVESLCPGNKLEMFGCGNRAGWKTWGVNHRLVA